MCLFERVGMFFALKYQTPSLDYCKRHIFLLKILKYLLWIVKPSFPSYQLKEYFIVTFILSKKMT